MTAIRILIPHSISELWRPNLNTQYLCIVWYFTACLTLKSLEYNVLIEKLRILDLIPPDPCKFVPFPRHVLKYD